MKVKVRRNVFETNSSSIHSISIIKNNNIKEYPETVIFGTGYFGWESDLYDDTEHKAAYLWQCMKYAYDDRDSLLNDIEKIENILQKYNIIAEFPYKFIEVKHYGKSEYTYSVYTDKNGNADDGYVDHGMEAKEWVHTIINDEQMLLNYLFDNKSYVTTGNDNDDEYVDCPDYGPAWYFDKGN